MAYWAQPLSEEPVFGTTEVSCTFTCSKLKTEKDNTEFSMVVSSRGKGGYDHGEAHGSKFPWVEALARVVSRSGGVRRQNGGLKDKLKLTARMTASAVNS